MQEDKQNNNYNILLKGIRKYSLINNRTIQLSNGSINNTYVDIRKISLNGYYISIISELLYNKLSKWNYDVISGLTLGADPLISGLICHAFYKHNININGAVVRKNIKKYGMQNMIEGIDVNNHNVIIIDDVCTTGKSILNAIEAVKNNGGNIIGVATIVDRGEGVELFKSLNISYLYLYTLDVILKACPNI